MLISIYLHTDIPFGFPFFFSLITLLFFLSVCFFFTELVPVGPCITLSFA